MLRYFTGALSRSRYPMIEIDPLRILLAAYPDDTTWRATSTTTAENSDGHKLWITGVKPRRGTLEISYGMYEAGVHLGCHHFMTPEEVVKALVSPNTKPTTF